MKGLFKNNFFAVWLNAKIFLVFMLAMGMLVILLPAQTLQMYFIMIGIVGFSINAANAIGSEFSSKWGKYKLTLPVKRTDIVKSLFLSQLLWTFMGVLLAGMVTVLSYLLHRFPFEQLTALFPLFVLGISISLFMGAIFIPLIYLVGEDKTIVCLVISLICAVGIAAMLFNITDISPLPGTAIMIGGSLLLFLLSCPFAVRIFKRKEY